MQQAARAMGPLVWLDMDQKALDDAYDQAVYAPNRDQVHKRNQFNSDRVRARLGAPKRLAYGSKKLEQLDLFATDKPNAPINIFVHGGAWRERTVKDYAFLAEMMVKSGAHWIGLDFDGVEGTNGNLLPMADQVRRAVAWVYNNAKSFGGDPERIYITSQSSGAHLSGNIVTTDWKEYGVPDNVVKGALLCSGMYDLKPVRLSKRSEYVAFTDEVEEKLSSIRRLKYLNCPVIVAYRVSWPDEKFLRGTLATIAAQVRKAKLTRTALILVGPALAAREFRDSALYDGTHEHVLRNRKTAKA